MSAVEPTAGRAPSSTGPAQRQTRLARWAVGIAVAVVVLVGVSYAIFGLAWALGGEDAVSDTFVGYLAGFALVAGMLASLAAMVMAIVAKVKHQRRTLLWLPMGLFPALLVVVALVEALWME